MGIDPGKNGGIAYISADHSKVEAWKMPDTERGIWNIFRQFEMPTFAVIELVRSSPQMGVVSAFTFGRGMGGLRMALIASGVPFEEVAPVKWQTALRCRTKGDKNVSKARAEELFPTFRMTHAIADALLIAEYAWRTRR